ALWADIFIFELQFAETQGGLCLLQISFLAISRSLSTAPGKIPDLLVFLPQCWVKKQASRLWCPNFFYISSNFWVFTFRIHKFRPLSG
ncbi:MAG: hypothetical protein ACLT5X_13765, partial [Blautia producta]